MFMCLKFTILKTIFPVIHNTNTHYILDKLLLYKTFFIMQYNYVSFKIALDDINVGHTLGIYTRGMAKTEKSKCSKLWQVRTIPYYWDTKYNNGIVWLQLIVITIINNGNTLHSKLSHFFLSTLNEVVKFC